MLVTNDQHICVIPIAKSRVICKPIILMSNVHDREKITRSGCIKNSTAKYTWFKVNRCPAHDSVSLIPRRKSIGTETKDHGRCFLQLKLMPNAIGPFNLLFRPILRENFPLLQE